MRPLLRVTASIVAMVLGTASAAATRLEAVEGDVLVNSGEGFKRVVGPTDIGPGDYVMCGPGAKANVVYETGTIVTMEEGVVYTVKLAPTEAEVTASEATAEGAAAAGAANGTSPVSLFSGPTGTALAIAGGAAAIGGVVAIASKGSSNGGSAPASP